jgi:hypothetical protein
MILLITGTFTFLAGIWIALPWYLPLVLPTASTAVGVSVTVAGVLNSLAAVPALFAYKRNNPHTVATGAFWLFLWYTFITLTRIIITSGVSLGWVTSLIIALIMAVIYVEQKYQAASPLVIVESTD